MEVMIAVVVLGMVLVALFEGFANSLRFSSQVDANSEMNHRLGNSVRLISARLRDAMSISITDGGTRLEYQLPVMSEFVDETTGEREFVEPIRPDGTIRAFWVEGGQLIDGDTGQAIAGDIVTLDPDPDSSQYRQSYAPFSLTTIGSRRAITINLIGQRRLPGAAPYLRVKTTVLVRNSQ